MLKNSKNKTNKNIAVFHKVKVTDNTGKSETKVKESHQVKEKISGYRGRKNNVNDIPQIDVSLYKEQQIREKSTKHNIDPHSFLKPVPSIENITTIKIKKNYYTNNSTTNTINAPPSTVKPFVIFNNITTTLSPSISNRFKKLSLTRNPSISPLKSPFLENSDVSLEPNLNTGTEYNKENDIVTLVSEKDTKINSTINPSSWGKQDYIEDTAIESFHPTPTHTQPTTVSIKSSTAPSSIESSRTSSPTPIQKFQLGVNILIKVMKENLTKHEEHSIKKKNTQKRLDTQIIHEDYIAVDAILEAMTNLLDQEPYFNYQFQSHGNYNRKRLLQSYLINSTLSVSKKMSRIEERASLVPHDFNDNGSLVTNPIDFKQRKLIKFAHGYEFSRFNLIKHVSWPQNDNTVFYRILEVHASFDILDYQLTSYYGADKKRNKYVTSSNIASVANGILSDNIRDGSFLNVTKVFDPQIISISKLGEVDVLVDELVSAIDQYNPSMNANHAMQFQKISNLRLVGFFLGIATFLFSVVVVKMGKKRIEAKRKKDWTLLLTEPDLDSILNHRDLDEHVIEKYVLKDVYKNDDLISAKGMTILPCVHVNEDVE